mgnify:CR=1 FL=1
MTVTKSPFSDWDLPGTTIFFDVITQRYYLGETKTGEPLLTREDLK